MITKKPGHTSRLVEMVFEKVAVLGGSGFIGSHLVMQLLKVGCRLNLLTNKTKPDFISPGGRILKVNGSIESYENLRQCLIGCQAVYHLVGLIAETKEKSFEKTVVGGTSNVVRAAGDEGVKKVFYLSALGTEEQALSLYHQTKWKSERTIIDSGLDYTIFRPSVVYGEEDKFVNMIARMFRFLPIIPVIGDGLYKLQPIYVDELCYVMVKAMQDDNSDRKIYELGGPRQLTYIEFLDIIGQTLNKKRVKIKIPFALAKMVARIMEKMIRPSPLTVDQIRMLSAGSICDNTKVGEDFGVEFSTLESNLKRYLEK